MRKNHGFTLVEIMIVLTLIGLLATMAIPAFIKVRAASAEKSMINDGRQLGSAYSQYFLEEGEMTASHASIIGVNAYVKSITPNNTLITDSDGVFSQGETFVLENKLYGQIEFNEDGSVFEKRPGVLTE
jgi:prepilin-type N-terminal cleavage/methylation domain